jgi:hypothetical protein
LRRVFNLEQYGLLVRGKSRLLEYINRELLAGLTSRSWQEDRREHLGR